MYDRFLLPAIVDALTDTPVIVINGARQTGKSTLCHQVIHAAMQEAQYVTFDDLTALAAAKTDPENFVAGLQRQVVLDEVQRVPELLLTIKKFVDQDRKERRFVLTGSADVMTLPKVSESLAGRIEIHNLWPLSQEEIQGNPSGFLEALISAESTFKAVHTPWDTLMRMMVMGGYPEVLARPSGVRQEKWFSSYMQSILQKDIRELANIDGLTEIPRLLEIMADRVGSLLNLTDVSRLLGMPKTTLNRYYALLQHVFLVVQLPAWTPNQEGRVVKSPKVFLNDTGLLCHLRGLDVTSLQQQRHQAGAVLENFVVMALLKQLTWAKPGEGAGLKAYHFRTHKGHEVDVVLEDRRKRLFGIEVKAAASVEAKDFKGLRYLQEMRPEQFQKGVVLYTGGEVLQFGQDLWAVPISALW